MRFLEKLIGRAVKSETRKSSVESGPEQPEVMFSLFEACVRQSADIKLKRNEAGEILAPNGLPSELRKSELLCKVVRTQAFKNWFGDWEHDPQHASKAVYKSTGEPRPFFHGTTRDIPVTEGLKPKRWMGEDQLFFASDKLRTLEEATGEVGRTISLKDVTSKGAVTYMCFLNARSPRDPKRDTIYDSTFHDSNRNGAGWWIVAKKEQVMHIPFNLATKWYQTPV